MYVNVMIISLRSSYVISRRSCDNYRLDPFCESISRDSNTKENIDLMHKSL